MSALVGYLLIFVVVGVVFVLFHLLLGKLVRPVRPHADKLTIYECGEPTIGSAWIQFDLRFYVIALLFVIFDVEVAFFFPWAVVFGKANTLASAHLPEAERQAAAVELLGPGARLPEPAVANDLAWLAFWDILVFFGVLIVGFAYLWRRGDLDWVRSLAAEHADQAPSRASPATRTTLEMVGAADR